MLTLWFNPMFDGVGIAHHYCMFPCSLCLFVRRRPVACVSNVAFFTGLVILACRCCLLQRLYMDNTQACADDDNMDGFYCVGDTTTMKYVIWKMTYNLSIYLWNSCK